MRSAHDAGVNTDSGSDLAMITVDRGTGIATVAVTFADGRQGHSPLTQSPFDDTSALSRFSYSPGSGLLAVTLAGHEIAFEMPVPHQDQLGDRLTVYLDQNQWSELDNALHGGAAHTGHTAARQLAHWVRQRRVVLPASSAHYLETTKRFDPNLRYRLGLTILQLSHGWQMRHPLRVRRDELRGALLRHQGHTAAAGAAEVFTLAPDTLLPSAPSPGTPQVPGQELIPLAGLTAPITMIDVMLDTERLAPAPDPGWAAASQRDTDRLNSGNLNSPQRRKLAHGLFLTDHLQEIAEAAHATGITPEQLDQWILKRSREDVGQLPATGLFHGMLCDRHTDRGTRWKPNDLIDMVYLSCAAGYADFVVCERPMGSILAQGLRRLDRSTQLFAKLTDAVPAIEAALNTPK